MGSTLFQEVVRLDALLSASARDFGTAADLQPFADAAVRMTDADRTVLVLFDRETRVVTLLLGAGPGWRGEEAPFDHNDLIEGPRQLVVPLAPSGPASGSLSALRSPDQPVFTSAEAEAFWLFGRYVADTVGRVRAARESETALALAQSAIRAKVNFLANLSHELRTPLNGILGFSQLLETTALETSQKKMLGTIVQSGQRLLGTVDNLLELAQFESGQFFLETAPLSPRALFDSVVAKHAGLAADKGLDWVATVASDLPAILWGDAVRIVQAWGHIVSNAVKFTKKGKVELHLESWPRPSGRFELVLHVADTGIGFAAGESGHWFMPFHQEDASMTRQFGGTGLGLALCDRIVRTMGGGVSLWGEPGVGTKVRVWVNLGTSESDAVPPYQSLRILVQDPEMPRRNELVRILEELGHRVDGVVDLKDAPGLPGLTGYQVVFADTKGDWTPGARPWMDRGIPVIGTFSTQPAGPGDGVQNLSSILVRPLTAYAVEKALDESSTRKIP